MSILEEEDVAPDTPMVEESEPATEPEPESISETAEPESVSEPEEPAQVDDDYDFGSVFAEDYDAAGVPERYRSVATSVYENVKAMREQYANQLKEMQEQARYHQNLWEQLLREDNPQKFRGLEDQIEKLQMDINNRQKIIDGLTEERDQIRSDFDKHATASNEQYLAYVERKWMDDLTKDRDEGEGVVLKSAEEMVVELQFDPDEALELGFTFGLEAMAEAADFVEKGMSPEHAYNLTKRIYSSFVEEPEPPPAQATHSPSAAIADEPIQQRAPERSKTATNTPLSSSSLDNFLKATAEDLFGDARFRRR
jgi:rubrerythrin